MHKTIKLVTALSLTLGSVLSCTSVSAAAERINYALGKEATASYSYNSTTFAASQAVDGDLTTRWATEPKGDNQWLRVDLGKEETFNEFVIVAEDSENQKIKKFKIEGSHDDSTYEMIYDSQTNDAGFDLSHTVTLDNEVTYRYVRITIESLIEGRYSSISLREFEVIGQVSVNKVDKTVLQDTYNECKDFTPHYMNWASALTAYNDAVDKAEIVLADQNATQDDVLLATNKLMNRYWFVNMQEYVYHYSPKRANFDYSLYETASILPLYTTYKKAANYSLNADTVEYAEIFKQLCQQFEIASQNVVLDTGKTGVAVGFNGNEETTYSKNYQGQFIINEEIVKDVNGKESLQLNITFLNNGINGISGEQKSEFSTFDMKTATFNLHYDTFAGKGGVLTITNYLSPIDGSASNGYTGSVNIDEKFGEGDYSGLYYVDMYAGGTSNKIYSPGYFRVTDYVVPEIDKTALQKAYDDYKDYEPKYIPISKSNPMTPSKFKVALETAQTILEDVEATQEQVDKATEELNNRYWAVRVEDNQYHYNPTRDNFDYSIYTTESIKPLLKAYYLAKINTFSTTPEQTQLYQDMCAAFDEAAKNVETYGEETGLAIGYNNAYRSDLKGTWTIREEVTSDNKLLLHVQYINDGIHSITGESKGKFSSNDMKKMSFYLDCYSYDGQSLASLPVDLEQLNGLASNGYEGILDVKEIFGESGYTGEHTPGLFGMRMVKGTTYYNSLGYYKVTNTYIDKTLLQILYDETKDYEPTYLPNDWHMSDLNTALTKALDVLNNKLASQQEVNEAYTVLNARYYSVKLQDMIYKFEPERGNFDYRLYTTQSSLPLVKHVMLSNRIWFGGKTEEYTNQYEEAIDTFNELEKQLELVNNRKGLDIGFNKDATRTSSKQGHFTITEKTVIVDNKEKTQLHIEFINDGIHPVLQETKISFTTEDMAKGIMTIYQKDYDGKSVKSLGIRAADLLPLDGQADKTAGFQYDIIVEPGEYTLKFSSNYSDNFYPGYFRTNLEVDIDKSALETAIEVAGTLTKDYYTETAWKIFEETLTYAKEVYENGSSTQKVVDEATQALNDALNGLVYKDADYSKVDEALTKVPTDLSQYSDETIKALNEAIASVIRDLDITRQEEVDAMAKAVNDALNGLVYKDADYSKVDEALTKVPTDLSQYSDETIKALNEAIASVIRDLDITRQEEVDAMAKAILDAIGELKEKPVIVDPTPMDPVEPAPEDSTPVNPVGPARPVAPVQRPVQQDPVIEEGEGETLPVVEEETTIEDNQTPQAGVKEKSGPNMMLISGIVVVALGLLWFLLAKKKKEEEEEA